jgi:mycoredoxin
MVTIYGADWCPDCRRSKNLLTRLAVPFEYLEVDTDDTLRDQAIALAGRQSIPVVVLPDGAVLVEPSDPQLRAALAELGIVGD